MGSACSDMASLVFVDNTVLCNFACMTRLDLLHDWLRGRWTEAVAYEAHRSASTWPELRRLPQEGWLDEPLEIDRDTDISRVEHLRRFAFGGTDDAPLRHLGEAQTLHVIQHWPDYRGASFASDDAEAVRLARGRGIQCLETIDVVRHVVVDGDLTGRQGYDLLHAMAERDRGLRLPATPNDLLT